MVIIDFKEKRVLNVAKNGKIVEASARDIDFVNIVEVTGLVVFNDEVELVTAKEEATNALQMAILSNPESSSSIARETDTILKLNGHNTECYVSSLTNKIIPKSKKQIKIFVEEEKNI